MALEQSSLFLSYAHSDAEFIHVLDEFLQSHHVPSWMDRNNLVGGANWQRELERAISDCKLLILVLSPHAIKSNVVQNEYTLAYNLKKPIIPLMIQRCELPLILNTLHYIDCEQNQDMGLQQLLRDLRTYGVPFSQLTQSTIFPESLDRLSQLTPTENAKILHATRFLGRDDELRWVESQLTTPGNVAIALTGMAGIGKTTLLAEGIRRAQHQHSFPDGVVVFEERDYRDFDTAFPLVSQLLLRFDTPHRSGAIRNNYELEALLRKYLAQKNALVVFDDLPPHIPAMDIIKYMLVLPNVKVVFTSRQNQSSLPQTQILTLKDLPENAAIDLFFIEYHSLPPSMRPFVQHIIEQLGCNPYGIVLAARYLQDTGRDIEIFSQELRDSFIVTANALGDPDAHTGIDLLLEKSVRLLSPSAQQLFPYFAAFTSANFGRKALLAVAKGLQITEAEKAVTTFLRRSLLFPQSDELLQAGGDRERLYRHPLVYTVASSYLDKEPATTVAEAMISLGWYYVTYLEQLPRDSGTRQWTMDAFEIDRPNILALLDWAITHQQEALFIALCSEMQVFWDRFTHPSEAIHYLGLALDVFNKQPSNTGTAHPSYHANLQLSYAIALYDIGRPPEAEHLFQENLAHRNAMHDLPGKINPLIFLGNIANRRGDIEAALAFYQEALAIANSWRNKASIATVRSHLGRMYLEQDRYDEAEEVFEANLAYYASQNDTTGRSYDLANLGAVALNRGNFSQAERYIKEALELDQAIRSKQGEGVDLYLLGQIDLAYGQIEQAKDRFLQSQRILHEIGDLRNEGYALTFLGHAAMRFEEYTQAASYYQESMRIDREIEYMAGQAMDYHSLAQVALELHERKKARRLVRKAYEIAKNVQDKKVEIHALHVLAGLALQHGHIWKAMAMYQNCEALAEKIGSQQDQAIAIAHKGWCYLQAREYKEGEDRIRQALEILKTIEAFEDYIYTLLFLVQCLHAQLRYGEACQSAYEAIQLAKTLNLPKLTKSAYKTAQRCRCLSYEHL